MSICAGVIIAVTFQQIDSAPDAKAGTESHDEGLQYIDCAVEECHNFFLLCPAPKYCSDYRAFCNEKCGYEKPSSKLHVHLQHEKGKK